MQWSSQCTGFHKNQNWGSVCTGAVPGSGTPITRSPHDRSFVPGWDSTRTSLPSTLMTPDHVPN